MDLKEFQFQKTAKEDETMVGCEDRISELPITILHHILSYLPMKVVGKTSVLSKRWQYIWDTYPIFEFLQDSFGVEKPQYGGSENWKTVVARYEQDLRMFAEIVDHKLQKFCQYQIESQKFILAMDIAWCNFPCLLQKWIKLMTLKEVKEVNLMFIMSCLVISISMPQLSFSSLTVFKISGQIIFREKLVFDDNNFPRVEVISLSECCLQFGVKVSCKRLKRLELKHCEMLSEIEISAPTLSSIQCEFRTMPSVFSLDAPVKPTEFQFCLKDGVVEDKIDTSWYVNLKKYLHSQNQTQAVHFRTIPNLQSRNTFNMEEASKRCHLPSHALQVLSLKLHSPFDYAAFMDGLLWSCHPKVLSVTLDNNKCTRDFYKFLCEKLTNGENEDCCCSSEAKCWVHSLVVKYVVLYDAQSGLELRAPFSRRVLLKAMPVSRVTISLRLRW